MRLHGFTAGLTLAAAGAAGFGGVGASADFGSLFGFEVGAPVALAAGTAGKLFKFCSARPRRAIVCSINA
jgi:hypothetical protein